MFRFSKQLLLRLLFRKTASPSMSSSSFFRPLRLNARVELQHRIVMAPLTRCRSDDELRVTPLHVEYYAQRATAGGLLITEATNIYGRVSCLSAHAGNSNARAGRRRGAP
jgi:2,4-dienoyl-CoA reductase-like NADH-dependent reductase (Old Yellow Enzyme family)